MPGDADASLTVPMSAMQRDAKAWQLARRAASVFAELQRSHSERLVLLTSSLCPPSVLSLTAEKGKKERDNCICIAVEISVSLKKNTQEFFV